MQPDIKTQRLAANENVAKTTLHIPLTSNPASGKVMKKAGMTHIGSVEGRDRDSRRGKAQTYCLY